MSFVGGLLRASDEWAVRAFGMRYMRFARDPLIAERCDFITAEIGKLPIARPIDVLDVGCGSAMLLPLLAEGLGSKLGSYLGIDHDKTDRLVQRYRKIATPHGFRQIDLDSDWDIGQFGAVVCSEVIEHLTDDRRLFGKLAAAVAPGGYLILTTPSEPFVAEMVRHIPAIGRVSATQDGDHVRMGYTRETLAAMARDNGLTVVTTGCISRFTAEEMSLYLNYNSPLGYYIYNLLHNRRDASQRFMADDGSTERSRTYWSMAITCQKA